MARNPKHLRYDLRPDITQMPEILKNFNSSIKEELVPIGTPHKERKLKKALKQRAKRIMLRRSSF